MKKSILILSLSFATLGNVIYASGGQTLTNNKEITFFETTPLCKAIGKGDLVAVKVFIEYGADVNEVSDGMTPLMLAARYNRVDIIDLLLEKGAKIDTEDESGNTAMQYAENSKAANAFIRLKKARKQ
jgi:uncharacterized protein